jgi:hypothetical protein
MRNTTLWLNKGIQFLLSAIITISIVYNIFPAFSINPWLSSNLRLIILCSAIPLLILNLCFFSKKSSLISASIGIILAIIAAVLAENAGIFSDLKVFEFSYSFYIIILVTAIITFAASNFRIPLIILFVATVIIFAALTILAYKTNWISLCTFLTSTAILYTFEFYCDNIKISNTKKVLPFQYALIACIFCFICIAASAGIYSIVKAGNLPVQKPSVLSNSTFLQLGKKYGFATIVQASPEPESQSSGGTEQLAAANTNNNNNEKPKQQQAPANTNNNENSKQQQPAANSKNEKPKQQQAPANNNNNNNNEKPKEQQTPSTPPPQSSIEQNNGEKKEVTKFNAITYFKKFPIVFTVVAIITILILIFVFKKVFRAIWYRNLLKTDQKNQIIQLYGNTLKILSVFGYKRRAGNTPIEFANRLCTDKEGISFEKYDFRQITDIFTRVNYGDTTLSNDDYKKLISFYRNILSYCRKDVGIFKFAIKYLML